MRPCRLRGDRLVVIKMPLRVGFDLDGTVADMYFALHHEAV